MELHKPSDLLKGELKGKLSHNSFYEGLRSGRIPSIKPSPRRYLVPDDWVQRMLKGTAIADSADDIV